MMSHHDQEQGLVALVHICFARGTDSKLKIEYKLIS
jgi:hypothetical protein